MGNINAEFIFLSLNFLFYMIQPPFYFRYESVVLLILEFSQILQIAGYTKNILLLYKNSFMQLFSFQLHPFERIKFGESLRTFIEMMLQTTEETFIQN